MRYEEVRSFLDKRIQELDQKCLTEERRVHGLAPRMPRPGTFGPSVEQLDQMRIADRHFNSYSEIRVYYHQAKLMLNSVNFEEVIDVLRSNIASGSSVLPQHCSEEHQVINQIASRSSMRPR